MGSKHKLIKLFVQLNEHSGLYSEHEVLVAALVLSGPLHQKASQTASSPIKNLAS